MKLVSSCCQSELIATCHAEGSSWYVCKKCGEKCNVFNVEMDNDRRNDSDAKAG